MKELAVGERKIQIRGSSLTPFIYKNEFGSDVVSKLLIMDVGSVDTTLIVQLVWAMAKDAVGINNLFPSFNEWLSGFNYGDFLDSNLNLAVLEVAVDGFLSNKSNRKHLKEVLKMLKESIQT